MNATIRGLSASLYEAMVEDHERSTGPWEIEWIVLPQICTMTCATLKQTEDLVGGLEVHPEAMRRNLDLTNGAIVSEAVMMGLGKKIGRQYAHDLVYDICRRAAAEGPGGKKLVEFLWENEEVRKAIGKEELERLCEAGNYLGLSVEMTNRVINGEGLAGSTFKRPPSAVSTTGR